MPYPSGRGTRFKSLPTASPSFPRARRTDQTPTGRTLIFGRTGQSTDAGAAGKRQRVVTELQSYGATIRAGRSVYRATLCWAVETQAPPASVPHRRSGDPGFDGMRDAGSNVS